jgi:hypothetical protein
MIENRAAISSSTCAAVYCSGVEEVGALGLRHVAFGAQAGNGHEKKLFASAAPSRIGNDCSHGIADKLPDKWLLLKSLQLQCQYHRSSSHVFVCVCVCVLRTRSSGFRVAVEWLVAGDPGHCGPVPKWSVVSSCRLIEEYHRPSCCLVDYCLVQPAPSQYTLSRTTSATSHIHLLHCSIIAGARDSKPLVTARITLQPIGAVDPAIALCSCVQFAQYLSYT